MAGFLHYYGLVARQSIMVAGAGGEGGVLFVATRKQRGKKECTEEKIQPSKALPEWPSSSNLASSPSISTRSQ
jgi:hypothetical protein